MDHEARTILLVDCSVSTLFYLGVLLKRFEYKVETARSAEDALRMMEHKAPSILISDIPLPRMSGVDLLRCMKKSPRLQAVPVVMLADVVDPLVRTECLDLGCAAFLQKPADPDELYRTLQNIAESAPREFVRLATSLKVVVGDGTTTGGKKRIEYATALSEAGLFVRTLYPQPHNAQTPVRLFLPCGEICAQAIVLYTFAIAGGPFMEPGMGMRFVEISSDDRRAIHDFIRERLTSDIIVGESH